MTFLERKRKIKQRRKFIFGQKNEKKNENDQIAHFRRRKRQRSSVCVTRLMAWSEWPWPLTGYKIKNWNLTQWSHHDSVTFDSYMTVIWQCLTTGSDFNFSFYNPKGTSLRVFQVFWAIKRHNPFRGSLLSVGTRKKNKQINKKVPQKVIFHPFARKSPLTDFYQIWNKHSSRGPNQCWNIVCQSVQGFRFYRGSNFPFSPRKVTSPL